METSVRSTAILTLNVADGTRRFSVPDPVAGLGAAQAVTAAGSVIQADPFEHPITGLRSAVVETVTTTRLIG